MSRSVSGHKQPWVLRRRRKSNARHKSLAVHLFPYVLLCSVYLAHQNLLALRAGRVAAVNVVARHRLDPFLGD